jgi:hypothetical protein
MNARADGSGAKNPIQQIKSTITYLKGVTFESITGLASTDDNVDDDGNAAGSELITEAEQSNLVDLITSTKSDMQRFLKFMKVENLAAIRKDDLNKGLMALNAKMTGPKAKA